MGKKRFLPTLLILITLPLGLWGFDVDPGGYGSIFDTLDDIFGMDNNAGLTAFPVLSVPMGGRSEGMAGAFAAVSDDISFLEWNPAGSSMLDHTELAFFHNNWIADTKLEGMVFASRYKNLGYSAGGKWLYTPFTEYDMSGERVSKGYYSEAVGTLNTSYNFFPSYRFGGISLGANLKGALRLVPDFADDQGKLEAGSGRDQSTAMVMADVGALTRLDFLKFYYARERNTSFALVLRNLGPPALGDPLPTAAIAALSYKPIRPLVLALDLSLPLNLTDLSASEMPYVSGGMGLQVSSFLSMRAGLQAKAGNVRLALGSALSLNRVDLDLNYTLDLMTQASPLNRLSLGVRFNLGDQGRKLLWEKVDALYLQGLDHYADGDIEGARESWEAALELDPRFDPAQSALKNIVNSQRVQRRINELETLN